MIVPFPLSQSDHQMQRVRSCVEQHRNAPFRSADWLSSELMKICETAPDNDTQPATSQEGEGTLANPSTFGKPTFGLSATPTPPTLSEDLRALVEMLEATSLDEAANMHDHDAVQIGLATAKCRADLLAALATQPATSQEEEE